MLWTLEANGFRQKSHQSRSLKDLHYAVSAAAAGSPVDTIQEMARVDPGGRASAAQMLVKCFDGAGLTTPRNEVPAICPVRLANASTETRPTNVARHIQKPRASIRGQPKNRTARNLAAARPARKQAPYQKRLPH